MKSGMIYSEIEALISNIQRQSQDITDLISTLRSEVVPQLEACYSGKAARRFNEVLGDQATRIKTYITQICEEQLRREANAQKAAYEAQDANLQLR